MTRPVLVIAARNDRTPEKEHEVGDLVSALPDGRVLWIDGHHDLHAEQPDVVAARLIDFSEGS